MGKSGKIESEEDRVKWAAFEAWVTNYEIQCNIAKFTKFFQYFLKHTLIALVGVLRDVSGRWWQTSPINCAE